MIKIPESTPASKAELLKSRANRLEVVREGKLNKTTREAGGKFSSRWVLPAPNGFVRRETPNTPSPTPPPTRETIASEPGVQAKLKKLDDTSRQVESLFLKDLIGQMRKGMAQAPNTGPMGAFAQDMMDQQLADSMGKSGGIGLAKMLYKNLSEALLRQEEAGRLIESQQTEKQA